MDVIHDCLLLTPVPYLSVAFTIFKSIYTSVQQIHANRLQLRALAQCVALMLQCLNTQYETRRLSKNGTAACLEQLAQSVIPLLPPHCPNKYGPDYLKKSLASFRSKPHTVSSGISSSRIRVFSPSTITIDAL